ncbi:uncharacterized protein PODANS_5_13085 [Podospora anserina S mat+]|uniref:Podospora anserina S mat+ genomic DNA chromosome 5, supercontig 3 n=1 Tax=Podospora anserina (strain S / ATCC MYA-4624 / DSM 980 / FGSC 10383) TaxID=515849 RepID=B2AFD2_PODAN|nr:uncharacterized protein PODANS_5_13085 [Podospora anserina S mat+]CAP62150.1 unnamed protein product [Podospora anserina S mat+]CDP29223.1 Putative protein of unknown function [Podospora anserina S mat+]
MPVLISRTTCYCKQTKFAKCKSPGKCTGGTLNRHSNCLGKRAHASTSCVAFLCAAILVLCPESKACLTG